MKGNGKTALVTGASSGIGEELSRILAREGYALVLTARNGGKLDELKRELERTYGVAVRVVPGDLSLRETPDKLYGLLSQEGVQPDVLVNNAGFGEYGRFADTSWEKESAMIEVNVSALTRLTKLFLRGMLARGGGRIMNVASTAAFQPGPVMAVYYATKAYVLSFTEALAEEYRDSGVTFTAFCPGPTETGFRTAAGIRHSKAYSDPLTTPVREVAEYGYQALLDGKRVAIPGVLNRLGVFATRFLPRKTLSRIILRIQYRKTR